MNLDNTISLSQIIITVLGIISASFGFIIRSQKEKINTIQNQLSDKKYKVYHEIYSIFFDLFKQQKGLQKQQKIESVTVRIIDIKKDLFIYAPDTIVQKFLEWNNMINEVNNKKHFRVFLELFILIRKDMGHNETKINGNDILRSIMTSDADFKDFIKTIDN